MVEDIWFLATEDDIREGRTTDIYFLRTQTVLQNESLDREVYAELTASSIKDSDWGVVAGVEDVLELLIGKPVDVYALAEGAFFPQYDINGVKIPVMAIIGNYLDFGKFETPILGFLCSKSGMTTRAVRIRQAADNKSVLSFGARRAHPAITPVVSYCAYIGGCDGISCVLGAEKLNLTPSGTIPHALIILFQDQVKAWKAFDKHIDAAIPRIALIDTYSDEKTEAIMAAAAVPNLTGVRLDTPGSRKGDFRRLIQEVRWELDIRGYRHVKIFISGGLGEKEVRELKDVVDGFGVGSAISAAPPIDFALDIVALKGNGDTWQPVAKRGKFSGRKQVSKCESCFRVEVIPWENDVHLCPKCKISMKTQLNKVIERGKRVTTKPSITEIRKNIRDQLENIRKQEGKFFQV
ncbi:MAG: nicotinate phosphoribosyltransferase [Candidatus Hodarchaeota archaeon]